MYPRAILLAGVALVGIGTGCGGPSYSDMKKELDATRYQYRLEQLYVAGLKVQNRQLTERLQELQVKLENSQVQRGY
jgi:hypothetical protein